MLKVKNLCVDIKKFKLNNISFELQPGTITGLIGANGAGKTTLISTLLKRIYYKGSIEMFGKELLTAPDEDLEFVGFNGVSLLNTFVMTKIGKLGNKFKYVYKTFDNKKFLSYLDLFKIDKNKTPSKLSSGMTAKVALAIALSHNSKILIFDEPMANLDPLARDEMLEIIRTYVLDNNATALISSHLCSDLEKICDYICYLNNGEVKLFEEKDKLIEKYLITRCSTEQLEKIDKKCLVSFEKRDSFVEALLLANGKYNEDIILEKPTLDELIIKIIKEEVV